MLGFLGLPAVQAYTLILALAFFLPTLFLSSLNASRQLKHLPPQKMRSLVISIFIVPSLVSILNVLSTWLIQYTLYFDASIEFLVALTATLFYDLTIEIVFFDSLFKGETANNQPIFQSQSPLSQSRSGMLQDNLL